MSFAEETEAPPAYDSPWPIVPECQRLAGTHTCLQHTSNHEHEFTAWRDAPREVTAGPGIPVRCKRCGGRKCDRPSCCLLRHHSGPHEAY